MSLDWSSASPRLMCSGLDRINRVHSAVEGGHSETPENPTLRMQHDFSDVGTGLLLWRLSIEDAGNSPTRWVAAETDSFGWSPKPARVPESQASFI